MPDLPRDTENRIKEAARRIFHEKGFAAARTRDIAEEAGINLALLNYYFRSKRKLFDLIMMETIQEFFSGVLGILNDRDTSLFEKLSRFVERYIDILSANPALPSFIMGEIRADPEGFADKLGILDSIRESYMLEQFVEAAIEGEIPPVHPLHFLMNVAGLLVFPFIAAPMLKVAGGIEEEDFQALMEDRKRLIPMWVRATLEVR